MLTSEMIIEKVFSGFGVVLNGLGIDVEYIVWEHLLPTIIVILIGRGIFSFSVMSGDSTASARGKSKLFVWILDCYSWLKDASKA